MAAEKTLHKHKEGLIKPGNEEYLSYYKLQDDWRPTKSKGPIGAMSSSPGPAIVLLPPSIGDEGHDPRKTKAPAYTIGLKDDLPTEKQFPYSPGPAPYDIRKKTNKGIDVCHAPKIGELLEATVKATSPGPAAYHKGESDKSVYRKAPAYTMRPKTKLLKRGTPTEPAAYTLPGTLGPGRSPFKKSPCYSMGERSYKTGVAQQRPGPDQYMLPPTDINKPKAPAYTMGEKEKSVLLPKTGISSPGPASNYYHMVKIHKPSTPRFSFGIRHTPYKAFQHFAAEKC